MSFRTSSLWLVLFCCAASLQAEPLQKTISDWQVTCNNQNRCEVRSFPGTPGLAMQITRQAGEDDRPQLRIDYGNPYSGELPGGALRDNLLLDGKRLNADLKHWQVTPHHWRTDDEISIEEFLSLLLESDTLQLLYRPQAVISLHGLKAALLLVDEVQGRTKGGSAWVASGDRSPQDVPPAPALPAAVLAAPVPPPLTRQETRQLLDYASWLSDNDRCSLDPLRRESQIAPLSGQHALLLMSCEMGAYNVIYQAFEVSRQPPFLARSLALNLPFVPPGGERQLELVNAQYDAAEGELFTFSKTRGLGDCGVATRWQYDGHEFRLVEYAQESLCDAWHGSDSWPTLWVTAPRPPPQGEVELQAEAGLASNDQ